MPIYCEHIQLVIPKEILEVKYKGGLEQFKLDHQWGKSHDHEDNELISIASMDNGFPIIEGLHYDVKSKTSKDFVIVARYGASALAWNVDWCKTNRCFIWHNECSLSSYQKMMEVSEMTVNELEVLDGRVISSIV
jgi:hypothetical protein